MYIEFVVPDGLNKIIVSGYLWRHNSKLMPVVSKQNMCTNRTIGLELSNKNTLNKKDVLKVEMFKYQFENTNFF